METFLEDLKRRENARFKLKVGVLLFLFEKDTVLLLRRFQTGIDDGMYVVPMGGHDGNETLTSAMIREAKEECNIDLKMSDIEVCHVTHRLHPLSEGLSFEQMDVCFRVLRYEGIIYNNEPDKCDDLSFFSLRALPKATAPCICHALECIEKGIFYSEFGFGGSL